MNKLWVALLLVLLLAVVLTVGLTVTFVYRSKDSKSEDKPAKEVLWTFHFQGEESADLVGSVETVLNLDIAKTADYEVDGHKFTVRQVSHDFSGTKVEGWAHLFAEVLKFKKAVHGTNTIQPAKVSDLAGFTVFNKEGKPDFVTLWHDGGFHHYSTDGKLLSDGLFPFANGDESKHPDKMDLPKDKVEQTAVPVPEPVAPAKDGEKEEKPEEAGKKPEDTAAPVAPPVDGREAHRDKWVEMDLDLAQAVTDASPVLYTKDGFDVKVESVPFGTLYRKLTFNVVNSDDFVPNLKYNGKHHLLRNTPVKEFAVFLGDNTLPLLVVVRDHLRIESLVHKGNNEWTQVRAPTVTADLLDDALCRLKETVMFDFSRLTDYEAGDFLVVVAETTPDNSPTFPAGFRSFTHTLNPRRGLEKKEAKVYKYKFNKVVLEGLPHSFEVSAVTATFWEGDLTKPLWLRLRVGNADLDYVGHRRYALETRAEEVPEKLHLLNFDHNHAVTLNLSKRESYDYTGDRLMLPRKDVFVVVEEDKPMARFTKVTHRIDENNENMAFHVCAFNSNGMPLHHTDVVAVETYFLDTLEETPVFVTLRASGSIVHYAYVKDKFVKQALLEHNLELTLRYVALEYDYVTLDVTKMTSYHFTGTFAAPLITKPSVLVAYQKNVPAGGFVKATHRYENTAAQRPMNLLGLKGADVPLWREKVASVDVYFVDKHELPVLIVLHSADKKKIYLWKDAKYDEMDETMFQDLEERLKVAAFQSFNTVYAKLDAKEKYEYKSGSDTYTVEVSEDKDVEHNMKKFVHTFPQTEDLRFTHGTRYLDLGLHKLSVQFNKMVVLMDSNERPFFITLLDTNNKWHYYKSCTHGTWTKADHGHEVRAFLLEATTGVSQEEHTEPHVDPTQKPAGPTPKSVDPAVESSMYP